MAAQPEPNVLYLVMRRANSMRRTAKRPANVENRRLCLIAPNVLGFARLEIIVGAVGTGNMERSSVGPDKQVYVQHSRA